MRNSSLQPKAHPTLPFYGMACYLVVLCLLSLIIFPVADDYSYALKIRTTPFWDYYINFYMTWSGRFFSNFIIPILGEHSNTLFLYQAPPIFLIVSFVLGIYHFISNLFACSQNTAKFLTIAFSATYFSGYVSMGQGLYWMSGGFTYQLAFNALVFTLGTLAALAQKKHISIATYIITGFCVVVASGCNEVTMFSTTIACTLAGFIALIHKHPKRYPLLAFAILALALGLAATFAPGNFARMDIEIERPPLATWFSIVAFRSVGGGFEAFKWLAMSPFLLFIAASTPHMKPVFSGKIIPSWSTRQNAILAFGIMWFVFFWDYFISIWSSGKHPYARVNNAIYTDALVASLIYYTIYLAPLLSERAKSYLTKKHVSICTLLLLAVLLMPDTLNIMKNTVNGDYAAHYQATSQQYDAAVNATEKNIIVPASPVSPRPIFFRKLHDPRRGWLLGVFKSYWGLKDVQFSTLNR